MAPNVLGSLVVNLVADTATFVGDLGKAARAAQNLGKDIDKSFSRLARIASQTFGAFGPQANQAISSVSTALAQVGRAAADSAKHLGKINGAMGLVGAAGGGAAAALTLVAGGALGLASSTAESIDKLGEQAQAAGVAVEALSALSFVAKQGGVAQDALASSLQRMSRAADTAASAPAGARNAFTQLGIAVKNTDGSIRGAIPIFRDVAERFASMPDGVQKTSLAIQIFGRTGAALIPVLNQGGAAIEGLVDKARALGIVLDEKLVQAADRFRDRLGEVGAGAEGAKIKLTAALLPALDAVAERFTAALSNSTSMINDFIGAIANIAKVFLAVGDIVMTLLGNLGNGIKALGAQAVLFVGAVSDAVSSAARGNFGAAAAAAKDYFVSSSANLSIFLSDSKKQWSDYNKFVGQLWSDLPSATPKPQGSFDVGTVDTQAVASQKKLQDVLKATADKYREQAATVGMLASQVENYRLRQMGATQADIDRISSLRRLASENRLATAAANADMLQQAKARGEEAGLAAERIAEGLDSIMREAGQLSSIPPLFEGIGRSLDQDIASGIEKVNEGLRQQIEEYGKTGAEIDIMRAKAAGATDEQLANTVALSEQLKKLEEGSEKLGRTWRQFGERVSSDFANMITEGKKFTDVLRGIINAVVELLIKQALLGKQGSAGGGLLGGIIGAIGGSLGGIFGGGLSIGGALPMTRPGGFGIPLMAEGGPVSAGRPYIVGDAGPELFVPGSSGKIMANGMQSNNVSVVYNIDARGATDPAATALAVQRAIQQSEERAVQRSVHMQRELTLRTA